MLVYPGWYTGPTYPGGIQDLHTRVVYSLIPHNPGVYSLIPHNPVLQALNLLVYPGVTGFKPPGIPGWYMPRSLITRVVYAQIPHNPGGM